ncbi:MAG: hypothetical protein HOO91_18870 [Bacteroidales bacterium]|nr:hypothetical protein [Bacteroidales bacterium]
MREKRISMIEQLEPIPSTNISVSINKEKINDYTTEWSIVNSPIEEKREQAEMFKKIKEDSKDFYPLFF